MRHDPSIKCDALRAASGKPCPNEAQWKIRDLVDTPNLVIHSCANHLIYLLKYRVASGELATVVRLHTKGDNR